MGVILSLMNGTKNAQSPGHLVYFFDFGKTVPKVGLIVFHHVSKPSGWLSQRFTSLALRRFSSLPFSPLQQAFFLQILQRFPPPALRHPLPQHPPQ